MCVQEVNQAARSQSEQMEAELQLLREQAAEFNQPEVRAVAARQSKTGQAVPEASQSEASGFAGFEEDDGWGSPEPGSTISKPEEAAQPSQPETEKPDQVD